MRLIDMLNTAAATPPKRKKQTLVYDTDAARRAVYSVLSNNPMSKAQIIKGTGLTEHIVTKTLKEMIRCESVLGVFPGEFGRRLMYIKGK